MGMTARDRTIPQSELFFIHPPAHPSILCSGRPAPLPHPGLSPSRECPGLAEKNLPGTFLFLRERLGLRLPGSESFQPKFPGEGGTRGCPGSGGDTTGAAAWKQTGGTATSHPRANTAPPGAAGTAPRGRGSQEAPLIFFFYKCITEGKGESFRRG